MYCLLSQHDLQEPYYGLCNIYTYVGFFMLLFERKEILFLSSIYYNHKRKFVTMALPIPTVKVVYISFVY